MRRTSVLDLWRRFAPGYPRLMRAILPVAVLLISGGLFVLSLFGAQCGGESRIGGLIAAPQWFDPAFFQYNLCLGTLAVLIVPFVTLFYARAMAPRKRARVKREIPTEEEWRSIEPRLIERSGFRYYFGSCTLATVTVLLGISIVLLFKPVTSAADCGVDLGRGVNMLIGGPYFTLDTHPGSAEFKQFYGHVIAALVGFQFGFVGAYTYFITGLSRSFFMLDLTPGSLVDGTVRMAIASLLSLVCSFLLQSLSLSDLVPISFFLGFFPDRALALLESSAGRLVPTLGLQRNRSTPLAVLQGMSYADQVRLGREGYDNVENLSHARAADLTVRTGFSYRQLSHWIDGSWLAARLRDDYTALVDLTGITSRQELERYLGGSTEVEPIDQLIPPGLAGTRSENLRHKLRVIQQMLAHDGVAPNRGVRH